MIINEDGTIVSLRNENATALQRIGIFDFANKDEMMAVGTSMYVPKDITTNPELRAQKFSVQQGAIELSNANIINEMINTINVTRNYETLSSLVREKSNQLSQTITLGRLNV